MTTDNASIIPLWLLYEDSVEEWRAAQAPATVTWLATQNFKGEKHRAVLVPDSSGAPCAAVAGLGKRQGGVWMRHAAGIADRLAARRFRLAQEWSAASATPKSRWVSTFTGRLSLQSAIRQVKTETQRDLGVADAALHSCARRKRRAAKRSAMPAACHIDTSP